jgi:predicted RNA-binding protein with RPS1 domain
MDTLEPGQVRRGVVSNLTSFGAFIDLGGADGLVHVSELSYNRVNHPGEILQVGQETDVFILSVDKETRKIALSLKSPARPVDFGRRAVPCRRVDASITKLAKFGAFAKIQEGLEGLIHLSELTDLPVQDASQVVQEGQEVRVKIIHINSQRRRLGLSVRQAVENVGYTESFGTRYLLLLQSTRLTAIRIRRQMSQKILLRQTQSERLRRERECWYSPALDFESNSGVGEILDPASEPSAEVPSTSTDSMEPGDDNDEHSMATTGRQTTASE